VIILDRTSSAAEGQLAGAGEQVNAAQGDRPHILDKETRKGIFRDTLRATVSFEFAMRLQQGIFNNFAVEVLRIQPAELGIVRGINEIPGLLTAPLAVLAGYFRENTWAGICILIGALGLVFYASTSTYSMLILATITFSIGFHLFYPVQSSIIMKSQLPEERATKMGQMNSGAAAAALVSYFIVIMVTRYVSKVNYSLLHGAAAAIALVGGLLVMMRKGTSTAIARRKMEFNKRYMSYYTLTMLSGARRHITMTFAGFLLVQTYKTPVSTMVLLAAISSLIAIFTRPAIGRLIDSWGEQRSLMVNYLIVIPIFLSYAFIKWPLFLFAAYIVDNATGGFDVAIQTHMGKIAPHDALSNAYAMGSTMTHITGVSVPILGGFLWDVAGAPTVFLMGTCFAGVALWFSQQLDRIERNIKTTAVAS